MGRVAKDLAVVCPERQRRGERTGLVHEVSLSRVVGGSNPDRRGWEREASPVAIKIWRVEASLYDTCSS